MTATQARTKPNRLGRAVLLLGLPFLMAQSASDCLPSPDPKTTANPLALDCVSGGTQLFIPIELTVALDRYPIAETGLNADTSIVARFPADVFCAIADSGASTTDLESAAIGLMFDGVTPPGDESALHTAINLPIQGIDLVDACGGAYGSEITVDLGTVRSTPWLNGDWTLDFMVAPPSGMIILLKNIDLPGLPIPGPTVDFLSLCDPTDKSDPPNGTTDDPEDSPRLAADRDRDGIYETLAVAADQVQFGVQGHCVGHRCEDYNDCTIDTCDPRNYGRCSYENEPDGTACDFGGQPGVCNAGACVDDDPACATHDDCFAGFYCRVDVPVSCVSNDGVCEPLYTGACPGIVDPVCGCDGVTYSNACELSYVGVWASAAGPCECTTNADCGASEYCNGVTCDGPGSCTLMPTTCNAGPGDVVACDGNTYDSVCAAAAQGVRVPGEIYPPFF